MGLFRRTHKRGEMVGGDRLATVLPVLNKPWWRIKHLLTLNCLLIIPFLSQASVGFDGSMMNGLQSLSQWRNYFDQPSSAILGTINAMYPVGKIFGLFTAAFIGDRFGRKIPLYAGLCILIVGAALQGAAQNLAMFIIARLIIGYGTSFIAQTSPILVSELSYPTHRGKLTSLYFSTYYLGAILAAWTTYGTFRIGSATAWRIPSSLQAAIPVIQICTVWLVPESPRWQIANGRTDEARQTLVKYHAGGDETSALVEFELQEITDTIRREALAHSQTSYFDLFKGAANRRRTTIVAIVGFYGSWTGNAVIAYYLVLILNTIGITDTASQALVNGLLQVFNFFCAVLGGTVVDRIGRRSLWLISACGMCASFTIWTILSQQFSVTRDPTIGRAVVAFIFMFSFFFTVGSSPLCYAYPIEIYPYTLRGRGLTFSISITMAGLILGQFVNPLALSKIAWKYYIVFCILLFIMIVLVYFLFPETKGRTLEEIAEIFDGKKEDNDVIEEGSVKGEKDMPINSAEEIEDVGSIRSKRGW